MSERIYDFEIETHAAVELAKVLSVELVISSESGSAIFTENQE
jgi:hypothetical protein